MKKVILGIVLILLVVSFGACSKRNSNNNDYETEYYKATIGFLEEFYELYTAYALMEQKVHFYEEYLDDYEDFIEAEIEIEMYEELAYWEKEARIVNKVFEYAIDNGMFTDEEIAILDKYWNILQARV